MEFEISLLHSDTIYATDGVGVDSVDIDNYDNANSIGDPNTSSWLKIVMRCSKPKEPHDLMAVPVETVFVYMHDHDLKIF